MISVFKSEQLQTEQRRVFLSTGKKHIVSERGEASSELNRFRNFHCQADKKFLSSKGSSILSTISCRSGVSNVWRRTCEMVSANSRVIQLFAQAALLNWWGIMDATRELKFFLFDLQPRFLPFFCSPFQELWFTTIELLIDLLTISSTVNTLFFPADIPALSCDQLVVCGCR